LPQLVKYHDYTREEAHDIFAPEMPFTPQAGTWGLHGIVSIPNRPSDFVFFVTFGQRQGDHVFDEGVTTDGVLTWQSQPRQKLGDRQIQQLINHNEDTNTIYLFLRTGEGRKYSYLGTLKYLSHDAEREQPVYFQWQILDWTISDDFLNKWNLQFQESSGGIENDQIANRLEAVGISRVDPPDRRNMAYFLC